MSTRNPSRKRQPTENKHRAMIAAAIFGLILIVVVIFVIRPTSGTPSQAANNASGNDALLAQGQALYQQNCAACHGDRGQGHVVPNALALDSSEVAWQQSDEQLTEIMRQGRGQMPAMGANFSDQEVEAVITYLKSWWTPEQQETQSGTIGE